MKVARFQDLLVWQRSMDLARAVSAIDGAGGLQRDRSLRDQLTQAALSVASNIAEGFGQQTDRAFAAHLHIALGSNYEVATQLRIAYDRGYITRREFDEAVALCDETGRMLTDLIHYLRRSDRRLRG